MRTVRQQLTRLLLGAFTLLLGAGGAGVYFSTREALLQQFDETLRAKANAISSGTEQHGKRINIEISEDFMREYDDNVAVEFFELWRADGSAIRRSKSLGEADLPARYGTYRRPKFWNLKLPSHYRGRAIGYTFALKASRENEPSEPAELSIVVASDRRELDETLAVLALVLLGCGALMLVATGLIVPRVLGRGLNPLNQLAEQTTRIDADSLSTRFPIDSLPGELKPIGERLNNLLSRLEQSFERERQFSADLAHELRTPIAELRSLADVALKWPESRPEETDRDTLAIAVQMEGIVVRLLELLRSERGQLVPRRESILLSALVDEIWQPFAEKASAKQLKVTRSVPEEAKIESDPILLRSIITNFVENAVEYTPRNGTIRIDAGLGGERFTLRIGNTVENLEPADLPRFFDRFWRKDSARSGGNHSGLGLSLARAFSQALGYELTVALDGDSLLVLILSGPVDVANRIHRAS
jgi:signal transduction histidine kinase